MAARRRVLGEPHPSVKQGRRSPAIPHPTGAPGPLPARFAGSDHHEIRLCQHRVVGEHGHLLGAAGVIEAIACIQAVVHDIVPPTINHFTDDPELDSRLNFTFEKAQKRTVRAALSNTFGFGGHNACVIVKKFEA